jgi:LuxR family maltose regulon positive regulatory protein
LTSRKRENLLLERNLLIFAYNVHVPDMLLQTKLAIPPPRPSLVLRSRLTERLNQGLAQGCKLCLVSAPAGFGKTTLVSHWAQQAEQPVAWLSLDESDNDLIRFLTYFIAALQTIDAQIGEGLLAAFQSPEGVDIEAVLIVLVNETIELADHVVLVLDDYHLIDAQPVNDAMAFLLDHLSNKMRLVMLTRADPPFPLPRMRARGELLEIRERDLRCSLDEASTFLRTIMGIDLSADTIQKLQSRTEGWIAGLQLAALSLKGDENQSLVIDEFSSGHHYIVDYLLEEVLNRQSESLRTFLMQTSILGRLNGSLCDALTGRSDGEAMLIHCEKANLFVSPLGREYRWHRYHRLFADVMANSLQRRYPDQVPGLHLRAAEWFKQNDLFDEAIKHALLASEFSLAAEIVEDQAQALLHQGLLATLLNWLNALPANIVRQRPRLGVDSAWAYLLIGRLELVEDYLSSAEKDLDSLDNPDDLRGQIAAVRAYRLGRLGQFDQAIDLARVALELLPEDDYSVRCVVAFVLGGIYQLQQDAGRALAYLRQASQLGEQAGNIHLAIAGYGVAGDILKSQAKLAEAEEVYTRALQLGSGPSGKPLPMTAGIHAYLAELRLTQGDLSGARDLALTGLNLGKKWVNRDSQIVCYLILAQIEQLEGQADEASASLEEARRLATSYQVPPEISMRIMACEAALESVPVGTANQGLLDPLSERELEVLRLFAQGMTNQEIADQLIISLGTVKAHSSNIYRKLDVRNRAEAAVRAGELNLL